MIKRIFLGRLGLLGSGFKGGFWNRTLIIILRIILQIILRSILRIILQIILWIILRISLQIILRIAKKNNFFTDIQNISYIW